VLNGTPLDDRFTNVARLARDAGYDPTLFGYTDTSVDPRTVEPDSPWLSTYEGPLPGFTWALPYYSPDGSPWLRWLESLGYTDVPERDPWRAYRPLADFPGAREHGATWAPTWFSAEHTETAFQVNELRTWFEHHGDRPWFVHASFIRPHPPYRNPIGYHDRYDADDGPGFRGFANRDDERASHPLARLALDTTRIGCPIDERERRQLRATYWGAMAEVDDQLGALFEWMERSGLLDDTLIVLTSDHGEQGGDHWFVDKLLWFDASYHVPMIVVDPRRDADATRGTIVRSITEHVDVLPTLCAWLGAEVPLQCDGRPLQPFLHDGGPPAHWRTEAHWEFDFRDPVSHLAEDSLGLTMEQCCLNVVRGERWKYVHFAGPCEILPPLLFDLDADPDQTENLAGDPAHAAEVARGAQQLLTWRMAHDERLLTGTFLSPKGMVVRRDERR
jgi:arylsulfatase A-like enzyme